jgi:hypothetical protein
MEFKKTKVLTLEDYYQFNIHHAGKRMLVPNIIMILILPWIYVMGTNTPIAHFLIVLPLAFFCRDNNFRAGVHAKPVAYQAKPE